MEKKPVYLIMVDPDNNGTDSNKFYTMTPLGDGNFKAEWGRVGGHVSSKNYPMSKWDSTINSKKKKGYVERTNYMEEVIEDSKVSDTNTNGEDEFTLIKNVSVRSIIKRLFDFANKTIQSAYRVNASVVTQAMVDSAQEIIDFLSNNYSSMSVEEFNKKLIELFQVIPRKMRKVADHLSTSSNDFESIITREQSLLDTMAGQVYVSKKSDNGDNLTDNNEVAQESMLDKMGITMEDATEEDIKKIKKAMGDSASKFYKAWRVTNKATEKEYQDFTKENNIGNVRLLCHGSRNANWFNILKMGLKIRPAGAILTGSMFGYGCYWSNPDKYHGGVAKSIRYTSLDGYWSGEYTKVGFIAFFDVALGESYDAYSFDSKYYNFDLKKLKEVKPNAWSLHAHGNTSMLRNDEIITYTTKQSTIRYLVEIH